MTLCCWMMTARLLAVALLNLSLAQATKERMQVSQGGVNFNVIRFNDGRSEPFNLIFKVDNEASTYKFNTAGDVTDIKVGSIKYEVGPTSRPDVTLGNKQSPGSTSGGLAEDSEASEEHYEEPSVGERRRLYACGDCEDAWDAMCGRGLNSVCDLVDYGSPFEASAEASISTMCDGFGDACSRLTASLACEGQCEHENGNGGACDPNPCNAGTCSIDSAGGHMCSCPDGFGGMSCQTDTADLARFYIEIFYNGTWTEAQKDVVRAQADRWEQVITHVPCGGVKLAGVDFEATPAGRLQILASQVFIDGAGETLGGASPTYVWSDCPGVSIIGALAFDVDDLAQLSELELELLYLHEMAHVIGFGINWEECSTCEEDNDPEWTCPAAAAVYVDLLGASPGTAANIIDVEGDPGTRCAHWSEEIFDDETMTGFGEQGAPEPLSKVTVASLEDIGYIVDPSMVEPYTLPARRGVPTRLGASAAKKKKSKTAFDTTKYYVDKDGNIVKEKHMKASVRF